MALKNSPGVGTVSESRAIAAFSCASVNGDGAGVAEVPSLACCAPEDSTNRIAMMLGNSHFHGGGICTAVYQWRPSCPALRNVSRLPRWSSTRVNRPRSRRRPRPRGGVSCLGLYVPRPRYGWPPGRGKAADPAVGMRLRPSYQPPPPETIFLYAAPVTLDVFRRETRGCREAKAKCA